MLNKLHKLLPIVAILFVVAANLLGGLQTRGAETASALQSDPEGWIDILPAADLKGWHRVPVPPTGQLGREQWHVDGQKKVLICDGDGGHDMLLFDKEFGDAIFHFEFCYTKIEGKRVTTAALMSATPRTVQSGIRRNSGTPKTASCLARRWDRRVKRNHSI